MCRLRPYLQQQASALAQALADADRRQRLLSAVKDGLTKACVAAMASAKEGEVGKRGEELLAAQIALLLCMPTATASPASGTGDRAYSHKRVSVRAVWPRSSVGCMRAAGRAAFRCFQSPLPAIGWRWAVATAWCVTPCMEAWCWCVQASPSVRKDWTNSFSLSSSLCCW